MRIIAFAHFFVDLKLFHPFDQVGDGTTSNRLTPVDVTGLAGRVVVLTLGGVNLLFLL